MEVVENDAARIEETPFFGSMSWLVNIDGMIDNDALIKYAYDSQKNHESIHISNSLGYHSPHLKTRKSEADPELDPLLGNVMGLCNQIIKDRFYTSIADKRFNVDAWININQKFAYNKQHIHGDDCLLSAVYYAKVPENSGDFYFKMPSHLGDMISKFKIDQHPLFAVKRNIKPKQGDILVFPSWIDHGVEQNMSDEDRISFAFNIRVRHVVIEENGYQ